MEVRCRRSATASSRSSPRVFGFSALKVRFLIGRQKLSVHFGQVLTLAARRDVSSIGLGIGIEPVAGAQTASASDLSDALRLLRDLVAELRAERG